MDTNKISGESVNPPSESSLNETDTSEEVRSNVVHNTTVFTADVLKDSKAKDIIIYCLPSNHNTGTTVRDFNTVLLSLPIREPSNVKFITALSHDTFKKLVMAIGPQYIAAFQDIQLTNGRFISYCFINLKLETINAAYKAVYNCGKEFVSVNDKTQLKRSLFDAVQIANFVFFTNLKYVERVSALQNTVSYVDTEMRDSGMLTEGDIVAFSYYDYLKTLAAG